MASAAAGQILGELAKIGLGAAANAQGSTNPSGLNLSRYYNSRWTDQYGGGLQNRQIIDPALLDQLRGMAAGTAPSAAQLMLQAGLEQNQRQAYGMAAGAQGMSPALAYRQAQQANVQAAGQTQQQMGVLRAQEQAQAQQLLAQTLIQQAQQNDAAAQARESLLMQAFAGEGTAPGQSAGGKIGHWLMGDNSLYGRVKSLF